MTRPKKISPPTIRVSNALITNLLRSVDENFLSKIDANEPAKQQFRIAGTPINGINRTQHGILMYIGEKIAERYNANKEAIDAACIAFAQYGKEQIFSENFSIIVDLIYKDIFNRLYPDKEISGGYLSHIEEEVNKLCSMQYCILFPARQNIKRYTHFGINSTLLQKDRELVRTSLFGDETIGVSVRISSLFMENYPTLKKTTQIPLIALPISMKIDKDDLSQYIFKAILYNSGIKIKKAKEAQRKAEANGDNEIKTQQTKTELLTYREKVSNILRKVPNTNYKKPSRFLRALEKTAKSLEENGVITKFYISENSNGEQITNWVIDENFSY